MKQLFINIGFTTILFAFTLNINYCKKNDTVEQIKQEITFTGSYVNETRSGASGVETNDTLVFTLTATIPEGYTIYDGIGRDVIFSKFVASLYNDENIEVMQIGGFDFISQAYITYKQSEIIISGAFKSGNLKIGISYTLKAANGSTKTFRNVMLSGTTFTVTAEKDYSWGVEKNQKIYDNREAIAEILDRNARRSGEDKDKKYFLDTLTLVYTPNNPIAIQTNLEDTTVANTFRIIGSRNQSAFTHLTEKDVYDLRKIIE